MAISISCRCASGSSSTRVRSPTSSPSSASTGRARAAISRREMNGPRLISRIVNRLASTSRSPNRFSSCETTATPRRTASAVVANRTGSPSSRSSPESGAIAPATILTSVDLPAPFSPSSACTEPARTVKSAPASATTPP